MPNITSLTHKNEKRTNIPTAEYQTLVDSAPIKAAFARRNTDLDPQLAWNGKDLDADTLFADAPPLYIQEKIHPKYIVDDLRNAKETEQLELFGDFNGAPEGADKTDFYSHSQNWTNRFILGDSLQVMASLSEREGLRGKVQCIYIDPPYGIKFNSNFQWSTGSRDIKDGKREHITREPEQVKAFRDTWRNGIHSYLSYLRDRLLVARDLLTESGSCFVQIGDENVHRVRAIMDEIFGAENFVNEIHYKTNSGTTRKNSLKTSTNFILWYSKDYDSMKFRRILTIRDIDTTMYNQLLFENLSVRSMTKEEKEKPFLIPKNAKIFQTLPLHSMSAGEHDERFAFGKKWGIPHNRSWRHSKEGFERLLKANRIQIADTVLRSRFFQDDFPASEITENWSDTSPEIDKSYVVQTSTLPIQRCVLMTSDPGDLVLDPTCGSGTTAYVAEQWGRRWISIDTSRVALALARARLMGAKYPYYKLKKNNISYGFEYQKVPHITLKSIANNTEIDEIWEKYKDKPEMEKQRQREIDEAIAQKAEFETLYDKPLEDKKIVRVAGPFTVESVSPHRMLCVDENGNLAERAESSENFIRAILDNLKCAGVQQSSKEDKIEFESLEPYPGKYIAASGDFGRKAAIFIGPEFGTVTRVQLVDAAKEAAEGGFDVLISCAFNYDAHCTELCKIGKMQIIKARMNADLHLAGDLKNTGKGNLFVVFGEPDVEITECGKEQYQVKIKGVDVFDPAKGEVRSSEANDIACWFVDTNYNSESFFVRHAYFLGQNEPYKQLKAALKSEINEEAWASLHSDTSRPFEKPQTGKIAVKVINHLGDEVMKVFEVGE
jgi:adenine-specific DNA-methyltransferase